MTPPQPAKALGTILFFHGFTSQPQTLEPVAGLLRRWGWQVETPALPGHGTSPEDLARCGAGDWLDFACEQWDALNARLAPPYVAGLSLGGALALHVAAHRPVPGVAALAPALWYADWRLPFLPMLKWIQPWKRDPRSDIKGTCFTEAIYPRYHLRSAQEFLRAIRRVRQELPRVQAPVLGIQSIDDHVIPPACLDELIRRVSSCHKEYHRLTDSYHVLTLDNEYEKVANWMHDFFRRCPGFLP